MHPSSNPKIRSAAQAAALIGNDATLAITGAGGGLVEPEEILAAIERRFLDTGEPHGLTLVHGQGLGDGERRGLNRLAHEGLVARVIGAHWSWSPRMQALAAADKIEAYALPGGVIQHLLRAVAAGRPGLITHIGLDTMADPRREGGRMNARAAAPISELLTIDGRPYIRYKPLAVDFAILRGSLADAKSNISFAEEGANLDALVLAMAAHNCGGKVLMQVRAEVAGGTLAARTVTVPGALVDALVVVPTQPQSYAGAFDQQLSGSTPRLDQNQTIDEPSRPGPLERRIVGARASAELQGAGIVSFGFGMPDEVCLLGAQHGDLDNYQQTLDHGHYGGRSLQGPLFGFVRNGEALIDSPSQFDFYSGGGIDIAFVGFGEFDQQGDVNVSKLGGKIIGPGGFIEMTQETRKIVFCGTFEAKGLEIAVADGRLQILSPGKIAKAVATVEQVTFSGRRARASGKEVLFVTERAVFRLLAEGLALEEIAPGIDLQRDLLDRMGFAPIIRPGFPRLMAAPPCF